MRAVGGPQSATVRLRASRPLPRLRCGAQPPYLVDRLTKRNRRSNPGPSRARGAESMLANCLRRRERSPERCRRGLIRSPLAEPLPDCRSPSGAA
jgi:hypothetical protein